MDNPLSDSTKREVIDALGMNKQTFYKYFADVKEYGIVSATRKIGRATLYKINPKHPLVSMLREYETKVSLQIAEQEEARTKKPVVRKVLDLESSLGS